MIPIEGKYSTAEIMVDDPAHVVEAEEYKQILGFVNCSVFTEDSKIMPDYHYGSGCVIGFVSPLTKKVIPNVVGVDLYCNMMYVSFQQRFEWTMSEREALDRKLRSLIPMGKNHHKSPIVNMERSFPWAIATLQQRFFTTELNKRFNTGYRGVDYSMEWFLELCERIRCKPEVAMKSIGTLGGGNHFIEFSQSKKTRQTGVTAHSGSRNLGARIATYWQHVAKDNLKRKHKEAHEEVVKLIKTSTPIDQWDKLIKAAKVPPTVTGLEYLEGDDWYNYLHEIHFAKAYSYLNLQTMIFTILKTLNLKPELMLADTTVHTVHNCISFEDFMIRKGAVRSVVGEQILIPFNMEDGILVCEGKSNPDYFDSAPHGAGRLYGRGEMKRREDINTDDIHKRMSEKDIFISALPKDEVKEAYKDPAFIAEAIAPTATIIDELTPIWVMKSKK